LADSYDGRMQGEGQGNLVDLNMRIIGLYYDRQPSATQIARGLQVAGIYIEVLGFILRDEVSAVDLAPVMGTSEKKKGEMSNCLIRLV